MRIRAGKGRRAGESNETGGLYNLSSSFRQEPLADEPVEVAVEHALRVADLVIGPVVLHELVGVEDVAADRVAPEAHVHGAALPGQLGLPLLLGLLGERERRMRRAVCL